MFENSQSLKRWILKIKSKKTELIINTQIVCRISNVKKTEILESNEL
jgi:hypothetical protein